MTKKQFIQWLSENTTQVIEWHGQPPSDKMSMPRRVAKLQSNALKFDTGSWLYFNEITPDSIKQLDDNTVSIGWITYKAI